MSIAMVVLAHDFPGYAVSAAMLGIGTAMVYPTLLAAVGDIAHPSWRASAVGVYRLWRDLGYAAGAVLAGVTADLLGVDASIAMVAAITLISGAVVAVRFRDQPRATPAVQVKGHAVANRISGR